jgi:hypothetical protein
MLSTVINTEVAFRRSFAKGTGQAIKIGLEGGRARKAAPAHEGTNLSRRSPRPMGQLNFHTQHEPPSGRVV